MILSCPIRRISEYQVNRFIRDAVHARDAVFVKQTGGYFMSDIGYFGS
jgi:hypothetical protein